MTGPEKGFLLLGSRLGDPDRKPLTMAQLRRLGERVRQSPKISEDRTLTLQDLLDLGCDLAFAQRVLGLLEGEEALNRYLQWGSRWGCVPICRTSAQYPVRLIRALGDKAPSCLWAKGDISLLNRETVGLVGSRDLRIPNARFAEFVGRVAAKTDRVLVSGNAQGADRTGQNACLRWGGKVISVVAEELHRLPEREGVLYLSEDDFDAPFTAHRALSRNRVIHILSDRVYVAQCTNGKGGTWDGTTRNLREKWSPVFCFRDGSDAMSALEKLGACLVDAE